MGIGEHVLYSGFSGLSKLGVLLFLQLVEGVTLSVL